jgi:selenocysteine-specific elongation factor
VEQILTGTRAAINLQGMGREDISRGDVIARPDTLPLTHLIDASLRLVSHLSAAPGERASVLCHVGSIQMAATLTWMGEEPAPGERAMVQIRLERPMAFLPGEAYVLRGFSENKERGRVLGGGRLLTPGVRRHRKGEERRVIRAQALAGSDRLSALRATLSFAGAAGATRLELERQTPLSHEAIRQGLLTLEEQEEVASAEDTVVLHEALEPVIHKLERALDQVHQEQPFRRGVSADELRTRVRPDLSPALFSLILKRARKLGGTSAEGDLFFRAGFEAFLSPEQREACDGVRAVLKAGGLSPPRLADLPEATGLNEETIAEGIKLLVDGGEAIRVGRELIYDSALLSELRVRLVEHLKSEGTIDAPTFKTMTGASRKWTIPLLEHFDRERLTVRVGDHRKLR